jgi:hypothetical protein
MLHCQKKRLAIKIDLLSRFLTIKNQGYELGIMPIDSRCLVPTFDGVIFSVEWSDAL